MMHVYLHWVLLCKMAFEAEAHSCLQSFLSTLFHTSIFHGVVGKSTIFPSQPSIRILPFSLLHPLHPLQYQNPARQQLSYTFDPFSLLFITLKYDPSALFPHLLPLPFASV